MYTPRKIHVNYRCKYKQSCKLLEEYIQEYLYMIEEFGETFSGQPIDKEAMKEKQY